MVFVLVFWFGILATFHTGGAGSRSMLHLPDLKYYCFVAGSVDNIRGTDKSGTSSF